MRSPALWNALDTAVGEGARQVLDMHKFTNAGDMACSELDWQPARARVQLRQFSYMWRLLHEAPTRTRKLHRALAAAPRPDAGYSVDRACTVQQGMVAVLGTD
jgi:hypothetical protein